MAVLDRVWPALAGGSPDGLPPGNAESRRLGPSARPDPVVQLSSVHLAVHTWEAQGPTVLLVRHTAGPATFGDGRAARPGVRVVAIDFRARASTGRRTILPGWPRRCRRWPAQPSIHAVVAHSFGCVVTALALRRGWPASGWCSSGTQRHGPY
jgi:hypothetical protein